MSDQSQFTSPRLQFFDNSGDPLAGGELYFYEAGTTTPIDTYSDAARTVPNSNPVVLDAAGRAEDIYMAADSYKIVLKDSNGVTIWTADNYTISSSSSIGGGLESSGGTLRIAELVNNQTGTSYTLVTGDRGKLVTFSNANPIAVTLPQSHATNFPDGWYVDVNNRGAGTVTITPTVSTIDGAASLALTTGTGVRIVSDGTNYFTKRGYVALLDEDNMASDSATRGATQQSIKAYVDTQIATRKVLQQVRSVSNTTSSGTDTIPLDNTIPQITEGKEYMNVAITPVSASSKLVIEVDAYGDANTVVQAVGALFVNSTADAIAAAVIFGGDNNDTGGPIRMRMVVDSGSVSARTYRFRAGLSSAGTFYFNRLEAGALFGGVSYATMTVTEYSS